MLEAETFFLNQKSDLSYRRTPSLLFIVFQRCIRWCRIGVQKQWMLK